MVAGWRRQYNEERPHSSLAYQTPQAFRQAYEAQAGTQPGRLQQLGPATNQVILTV